MHKRSVNVQKNAPLGTAMKSTPSGYSVTVCHQCNETYITTSTLKTTTRVHTTTTLFTNTLVAGLYCDGSKKYQQQFHQPAADRISSLKLKKLFDKTTGWFRFTNKWMVCWSSMLSNSRNWGLGRLQHVMHISIKRLMLPAVIQYIDKEKHTSCW